MASFAPIRGTRSQIQATPIVDGQFLVETDQGIDNKIYMDEGSTRTIVGGNTVTGVLPELYIYSETGSVVTVEDAGGTSIPTSQVGTDHWICEVPDYGVYTVYSVLSGDTTTQSINVTDCMIYTIDDSHFHCNVVVTYPSGVGASCQISGGGETYSAPALNPPDTSYKFVVHGQNTTYTITTNVDGVTKTTTVTTGTTIDQTYNVSMPYARVNLTVETPPITGTITCTDGTTTITRPVAANITLYLDAGTWTISGSDGVDTYDTEVVVSDLTVTYNADLSSAPDGATVLPTDDIQIWLQCAKIKDKSYTTLEEVLDDNKTLQKLISSENAVNYMVRSKTWIQHVEIPLMTSDTTPSGVASCSKYAEGYDAYNAFDRNSAKGWYVKTAAFLGEWLGYEFPTPVIINRASFQMSAQGTLTLDLKATNNNNDWANAVTLLSGVTASTTLSEQTFNNSNAYKYYRWYVTASTASTSSNGLDVQLYGSNGITEDSIAMRLIGEKNYASNILLDDSDWREGICNSDYFESVLNYSNPIMTSNTAPEGVVSASHEQSGHEAWMAFDNNDAAAGYWSDNTVGTFLSPCWLQYEFVSAVKIYKYFISSRWGGTFYPQNWKVQGSNDGFVSDINDLFEISGVAGTPTEHNYILTSFGTYKYYRLLFTAPSNSGNMCVNTLRFYGRKDVDETVYHVYSAADDTIIATPQGGGSAITITTNNNGYGTIAKSSLPNDTYILTSSKAYDPDNLSNHYSETITINNNNVLEICLMPNNGRNMLYWYGFVDNYNAEDGTAANGWSMSGYTLNAPTYNINSLSFPSATNTIAAFASKNTLPDKTVYGVIEGVTAVTFYADAYFPLVKNLRDTSTTTQRLTTAGKNKYTFTISGNRYFYIETDNGRNISIESLWYE